MKSLVVIGGGGHAKVVIDVATKGGVFQLIGYVDIEDHGELGGIPYLGKDDFLPQLIQKNPACAAAMGIGIIQPNLRRIELLNQLGQWGYNLSPIISPYAIIGDYTQVGDGTVILHGAILQTGARIGKGSILNTHCTVEHDCIIGDHVHIAPGAVLCGSSTIGDRTLIGAGAIILPGCRVLEQSIIGAGALIKEDCTESGRYVGVPARKIS
jgi:sugar O-acyltransferase (sialic acid O-acetyltransferase NeuD family)